MFSVSVEIVVNMLFVFETCWELAVSKVLSGMFKILSTAPITLTDTFINDIW